ncbi:TPA: hypothetical protein LC301_004832 [Salmonella enterica subsp. enterica serovar Veneziana]|nr:hypothetical protein [Salmonella enterica subsp. enterica serovar Veneziana]
MKTWQVFFIVLPISIIVSLIAKQLNANNLVQAVITGIAIAFMLSIFLKK